jgi:ABC-type Fe3+-hydroxamate transport system substrate-binding protein
MNHLTRPGYRQVLPAVIFIFLITSAAVSASTVSVKDSAGRLHMFKAPPERVVCLVPSAAENYLNWAKKMPLSG